MAGSAGDARLADDRGPLRLETRSCRAAPVFVVVMLLASWLLGGGLGAVAPAAAGTVDVLPAPGALYRTVLEVAHKQVPLPPGSWQVAGSADESLKDTPPGAYGVMESLALFKLEGGIVLAFVVIHTNALPVDRGWGTSSDCAAGTLPLVRVYDDAGTNLFCAFGGPVALRQDDGAPRFWHQALDLAQSRNWIVPEHWLMSGFRISDRHDVLEVRYYYQPDLSSLRIALPDSPPGVIGTSWSGPAGAVAGRDRGERPWLAALVGWSEAMKDPIEQGFKGRLSSRQENPRLPSDQGAAATADGGAVAGPAPDSLTALFQKSVLKMLSWKVLGISAGFTIKYLFIGDLTTAAGLQVATSVVTGVLFVVYDMAWATVFPGNRKPVIDFSCVTVPS